MRRPTNVFGSGVALLIAISLGEAGELQPPASTRYAVAEIEAVPDFQRHILPLMSRLGCNGRACHGSFQGQGGFRLSLFGYDFDADHQAILAEGEDRVDAEVPELSLIVQKPTLAIPHEGGKLLDVESWQYMVLSTWIESGAPPADGASTFERLEVLPSEILFTDDSQQVPLQVIAHWADGSREDVTCLTRFQTNDESIALVDADGLVSSAGRGDTHIVAFYDNGVAAVPVLRPVSELIGPMYPDVPSPTEVDRLVLEKLRKLGIVPSETATDAEFLRRVSLDLTGTLPTPAEVKAFLVDDAVDKRARKIDELLERPTYAAWWTNRLCDLLGASGGNFQGLNLPNQYARQWYDWIYRRIAENVPYDALIADIVLATSRKEGQSYEDYSAEMSSYFRRGAPADFSERETMPHFWARRNLRQPEEKALAFSYAFLGVRLDCAQCHKHPFDQWTQQDFRQFQDFFLPIRYGPSREAVEQRRALLQDQGFDPRTQNQNQFLQRLFNQMVVNRGDPYPWEELTVLPPRVPARPNAARPVRGNARVLTPKLLGGDAVHLTDYNDPRQPLMEWMRDPENPYFARALVNRVWANYFGRGLVDPPDDMNLANPPSNGPLLEYLATGFVSSGFDMKWLHREITGSETYQRSWKPNETNRLDERNHSRAGVRRLPAEVILDAIKQTSVREEALSAAWTSLDGRGIGPDGTERFRRTGAGYADGVFGRSARDTNCDCSRSDEPNLLQLIYLQNDPELLGGLEREDGWIAGLGQPGPVVNRGGPSEADLARQLARIELQIRRLEGKNPAPLARVRLERRRDMIRTQLAQRSSAPSEPASDEARLVDLISEAYLRSLSRPPDDRELTVAEGYLNASNDLKAGLRDLLWALLNTKEFMTNH